VVHMYKIPAHKPQHGDSNSIRSHSAPNSTITGMELRTSCMLKYILKLCQPPPPALHSGFFVCLFVCFCGARTLTQGLHLEPLHQPYFCDGFFKIGSYEPFAQAGFLTLCFLSS
jgi:hypothetical protein